MKIDFIGIGTARSGTTWLYNALSQHPDICLSQPKEINYFNETDRTKLIDGKGERPNKNNSKPLSWYSRHFNHCSINSLKGEFSVTYLTDYKAAELINKSFPDIKLLVNLRNPADRIYSSYWQKKAYLKKESRSFEQTIKNDKYIIDACLYYKHLSRYLQHFEWDQIHINLFEDIENNPKTVLSDTFTFLGVNETVDVDLDKIYKNPAKKSTIGSVAKLMGLFSRFLISINKSNLLKYSQKLGLKKFALNINTKPFEYPAINPETRKYIVEIIQDDLAQLEKLLGKDLSHWKQ